eukprot:403367129
MSDIFESNEEDFCNYLSSINKKAESITTQQKEKKESAIQEAQFEIQEADNCLKQMEQELIGFEANKKLQYEQRIKTYKNDLDEARRTFLKLQDRYIVQKNKETMMGAHLEEAKVWEGRQKLLQQNQQLDSAAKVGYDMEAIAVDIRTNLQGQSQKMQKIDSKLGNMNSDMSVSNRLMNDIKKGRKTNKLILYGVLSLILIAISLVIVLKLNVF